MKFLIFAVVFFASYAHSEQNVVLTPGSKVTIGDTVVSCSSSDVDPSLRCPEVSSSDQSIQVCSKRVIGMTCRANGKRGVCDFGPQWGNLCSCQD